MAVGGIQTRNNNEKREESFYCARGLGPEVLADRQPGPCVFSRREHGSERTFTMIGLDIAIFDGNGPRDRAAQTLTLQPAYTADAAENDMYKKILEYGIGLLKKVK